MEIQKSAFLSKNEVSDQKGSVLGGPNAGFWPVFGGPEDGFWGPNAGFRPKWGRFWRVRRTVFEGSNAGFWPKFQEKSLFWSKLSTFSSKTGGPEFASQPNTNFFSKRLCNVRQKGSKIGPKRSKKSLFYGSLQIPEKVTAFVFFWTRQKHLLLKKPLGGVRKLLFWVIL